MAGTNKSTESVATTKKLSKLSKQEQAKALLSAVSLGMAARRSATKKAKENRGKQ